MTVSAASPLPHRRPLGAIIGAIATVLLGVLVGASLLPFAYATLNPAIAQDASSPANRLFVQAMQVLEQADTTLDATEEARLLREADKLLRDIIQRYPDSSLAVQLVTNQFVGDFDYYDFRGRVDALVCVEPLGTPCFLHRIAEVLPPVETPVRTARWDWLSLAVAYHLKGDDDRATEIIAPFLSAVRRGAVVDSSGQDLFVGRALALIGQGDLALEITRSISDCSSRIYNLVDIGKAAHWRGDRELTQAMAKEAAAFAQARNCVWEYGLVVQALHRAGLDDDARTLFQRTVDQQVTDFRSKSSDCCPPELAVAAAEIGDANLALNLLRTVEDENPWAIPAVLGRLARRGEVALTTAYAERVPDIDLRGETFAELVDAAMGREDRATADQVFARLAKLTTDAAGRRPVLLAQRAKAERSLYRDEGWRSAFQGALNATDRASNFVRRDIGAPLLAVLVRIESGHPMLD